MNFYTSDEVAASVGITCPNIIEVTKVMDGILRTGLISLKKRKLKIIE
jgi:hypothetical protein